MTKCDCGNPNCNTEAYVAAVEKLQMMGGVAALLDWAKQGLDAQKDGEFPEEFFDRMFATLMVLSKDAQEGGLELLAIYTRKIREITPDPLKQPVEAFFQNTAADISRTLFEITEERVKHLCEMMGARAPRVQKVQVQRELSENPVQTKKHVMH